MELEKEELGSVEIKFDHNSGRMLFNPKIYENDTIDFLKDGSSEQYYQILDQTRKCLLITEREGKTLTIVIYTDKSYDFFRNYVL
jgi:hypothetical protein